MSFLFIVLIAAALLALILGVPALSQATLGVCLLAVGCFCAILARIVQGELHQRELRKALAALRPPPVMDGKIAPSRPAPQTLGQPRDQGVQ